MIAAAPRWYVLSVQSNFEAKIAEHILEQAKNLGLEKLVHDVLIPTETVSELQRGKRVDHERRVFPGYILIKMVLNDATWNMITKINRVSNFLGANKKPLPLPEKEAEILIEKMKDGITRTLSTTIYALGDSVRITDGPFATFNGTVEIVDESKQRLRVLVMIFGRATPIDIDFTQVEKV